MMLFVARLLRTKSLKNYIKVSGIENDNIELKYTG